MTPRTVARSERSRGLKTSNPRLRRRLAAAICSCLGLVRAQYQAEASGCGARAKAGSKLVFKIFVINALALILHALQILTTIPAIAHSVRLRQRWVNAKL